MGQPVPRVSRSPRLIKKKKTPSRHALRAWIATAVGCQSTHARLLEPEPSRTTGPRVYKSPWNPRPLQGNRPPCLQKLLEPEPLRTTGPRVCKSSLTWSHRGQPALDRRTRTSTRCSVQSPTRCSRAQTGAPAIDQPTVDNVARSLTGYRPEP